MLRDGAPTLVLTGAGVSAESGLATFRGSGGLWEGRDPMDIATPEAFAPRSGRRLALLRLAAPAGGRSAAEPGIIRQWYQHEGR